MSHMYASQIIRLPILYKLHLVQLLLILHIPTNTSELGESLTANSKACGRVERLSLVETLKVDSPSPTDLFLNW